MSKASARAAIYSALASAPTIHPANADLFTDWTLQGGDIVIVHSDNVPYQVPVYSMQLKWTGKPKVSIQSSGNEQLPSIEESAQRKSNQRGHSYRRSVKAAESDAEIHRAIYSDDGYLHTYIEVTASNIRTEVGTAISGMAQSVIEQTATYIRMEVANAASSISQTVIEQTSEYVRTEVASVASGVAWSVVEQTMTNITQQISMKSTVYVQWTDPANTYTVKDGDIWIKSKQARTWNQVSGQTWDSVSSDKWRDYYGCQQYVRRNNVWELVSDKGTVVENTVKVETTANSYSIVGKELDTLGQEVRSNLTVTANKIGSDVSTAKSNIFSAIAQTATSINLHVEDVKQGLQSNIAQTATSITLSVSAAKSSLYSTIEQTATQIRAEVVDTKNELQSSITQTASEIRSEVSSSNTSIWSSISQTSTQISLKVGKGEVISSINQTAEQITINASKINLDGYVKATDITSDYINGKIAGIDSVGVKNLAASGSISIKEGNTYYAIQRSINNLQITQSGNTYTLQYKKWDDSSWTTVGSFSRAISSWVTGGGSGKVNVTALPQNQTKSVNVSIAGNSSITSNGTYTYTVDYENEDGDDVSTGATKSVSVSVRPTKAQIGIARGARQTIEPTTDAELSGVTANGWYVLTVSVLGQTKTYKIEIDV